MWAHYLAIVAVTIAFYRPRLSPLWLMPLVFWAVPNMLPRGNLAWLLLWHAMLVLTLLPAAGVAVPRCPRDGRRERSAKSPRSTPVHRNAR